MKKIIFLLFLFLFFPQLVFASASADHLFTGSASDTSSPTTSSITMTTNDLELLTVVSRTGTSINPNQPTVTGDGLTWVVEKSVVYDTSSSSRRRVTTFRALGSPTTGVLSISFGGQTQTDVVWSLDEFSGVDISGTNGSGAVVQSAFAFDASGSVSSLVTTLGSFSGNGNSTFGAFGWATGSPDISTAGSGFTKLGDIVDSNSNLRLTTEFKTSNDTTVDQSLSTNSEVGGIALEIVAAITATPTPTNTPTPTPTGAPTATPTPTPSSNPLRPDHTVVVVEENQKLQDVLKVDYFTYLATQGALMVNMKALTHPSQPNYYALFAGALLVNDNTCPPPDSPFSNNNLGNQLLTNQFSFIGYAESMPSNPRTNCVISNGWANHHVPWLQFSNLPASTSANFSVFPNDYATLPTVSFVTPNLNHDAHDGTILDASNWLRENIQSYQEWAMTHNSLLVVTFDEDDETADNTIYTVFVGPMIKKGIYNEPVTLYNALSTLEDLYGLPHLNQASGIIDIFN